MKIRLTFTLSDETVALLHTRGFYNEAGILEELKSALAKKLEEMKRPAAPARAGFGGALDDAEESEEEYECVDDEGCGWTGGADDREEGKCPDCGKKTRKMS